MTYVPHPLDLLPPRLSVADALSVLDSAGFGSAPALADLCGVTRQAVAVWRRKRWVPPYVRFCLAAALKRRRLGLPVSRLTPPTAAELEAWRAAHGLCADAALARRLGTQPQTIAHWRHRGRIPAWVRAAMDVIADRA